MNIILTEMQRTPFGLCCQNLEPLTYEEYILALRHVGLSALFSICNVQNVEDFTNYSK